MPSRSRPSGRRRTLLFLMFAVVVAAAAGFWLTTRADDDQVTAGRSTTPATPTTESTAPVTDDLSTPEPERTGGAPVPTAPPSEVATDTPAPVQEAGDEVAPQLTYYGWDATARGVEAGGIVMGVVESGGTCTLTLRQGSTSVDVSVEAVDNVNSTSCPSMTVPGDRLKRGTWQATLSYESSTAQGVGAAEEVEVP